MSTNTGTAAVRLAPYTEHSMGVLDQFESISAQEEYADFSLEELRLEDYKNGQGLLPNADTSTTNFTSFLPSAPHTHRERPRNQHLTLLRGPGIELQIGPAPPTQDTTTTTTTSINTWHLPQRLISHHSPFFKAACTRDFEEKRSNKITLPDDDADVFALFVEWMYYGTYSTDALLAACTTPAASPDGVDMDAKCWVLGDKLLCTGFKNYAMRRLHGRHSRGVFCKAVTTAHVRYACEKSGADSMLRRLYVEFVARWFGDAKRVLGRVEEWDEILDQCADLRVLLLKGLRGEDGERRLMEGEERYLEVEDLG